MDDSFLREEIENLNATLTRTQEQCTALLLEKRALEERLKWLERQLQQYTIANPEEDIKQAQARLKVANEYRQTWDKETAFSYAENAAEYAIRAAEKLSTQVRDLEQQLAASENRADSNGRNAAEFGCERDALAEEVERLTVELREAARLLRQVLDTGSKYDIEQWLTRYGRRG